MMSAALYFDSCIAAYITGQLHLLASPEDDPRWSPEDPGMLWGAYAEAMIGEL